MDYPMKLSFNDASVHYMAILHVNFNNKCFPKCYLCGFPPMSSCSFYTFDNIAGLGVHTACAVYAAYIIFGAPKGISKPSLPSLPPSSYSNIYQQLPQLMNKNCYSAQPPPPPPPPTTAVNNSCSSGYNYQEQTPQYVNYYQSAPPTPPSNYNYTNDYNHQYQYSTKYMANAYQYVAPPPSTIIVNSNNNNNDGYRGRNGMVRSFLRALSYRMFPGFSG